jgi:hypothetical protein
MKFIFLVIGSFIAVQSISAQAIYWNGGNGDWNVPANWDCSCVPGSTDSVTISGGAVTIPGGVPVSTELIIITSGSTLINLDTLSIANAGAEGMIVVGSFENYGKVIITQAVSAGLVIKTTGMVTNAGVIEIDSIDATGISMEGTSVLINEGIIDIVAYYNRFGIYDEAEGYFLNAEGSMLNVYGGYPFSSALNIDGLLINEGDISLYRGDFGGLGKLINHGDLSLDHPLDDLHQGILIDHIVNEASGHIIVANTSSYGFVFNDTIINHGLIEVYNTFTDAFNISGTYMINYGSILVDSSGRYGILTSTNTVLRNETSATLRISNAVGTGLRIDRIQFYNNGLVILDTVGSNLSTATDHGIECNINGSMYNDTLGQILIDSCFASGLNLATAFASANHGQIHVRRARQNGIALSGNHVFTNTGRIDIDTLQGVGIILQGTTTSLHNEGSISIGPKMDAADFSINNSCVFVNDTCGYISTINKLRNGGTMTNHGFFKNSSTVAHTFTAGGTTTNEGVIEDYNGFILANANMDNFGIILTGRASTGCPSYSMMNALNLGDNGDYSVTGIYAENPSRSLVANYDSMTNIAFQSDIFPATMDWLWVIENIHTGCEDTIRMKVTVVCPVLCSTGDTNYWTGCLNTTDWMSEMNWTSGVPIETDDVIIPFIGIRPDPELTVGTTIRSMMLRKGTEFNLISPALLSIQ